MELPDCDVTLHFSMPSRTAEKQIAKVVATGATGQ
jgi:hypothetical protein